MRNVNRSGLTLSPCDDEEISLRSCFITSRNTSKPVKSPKKNSKALSPVLQRKIDEENVEARAQRLTPEAPEVETMCLAYFHDRTNEMNADLVSSYQSDAVSKQAKETLCHSPAIHRSPSFRRTRVRTLEAEQSQRDATTERIKRNTDSMLEDAVIGTKLKRRLASRRQSGVSRRSVEDASLSNFIKKSILETPLDALSIVQPTDLQLVEAANLALNIFVEGFLIDISSVEIQEKARQIFLETLIREEYHQGDYICHENDVGDKLFIIEEGLVEFVIRDNVVGTAHNGKIFGELSLVYGTPRYASVKAVTESVMVWSLDALSFRRIQALVATKALKASTSTSLLEKECESRTKSQKVKEFRKRCSSLSDLQEQSFRYELDEINFSNLKRNAILGKGTFGCVYLVSSFDEEGTKTNHYYALKCMSKASVVKNNNKKRVIIEKNVLQELHSPFIISLMGTHQDETSIFFLTEFVPGGNLMSYMVKRDILNHSECVFFSANIVAALIHIHRKGFIHRDLKPENCLIDQNGYLKLCDFGMAKRLPSIVQLPNGGTEIATLAFTMCGTPQFMAPEFVLSTGYDKGIDIWALGCMLVEMYTGQSPFEFDGDLKKTFQEVCLIGLGRKKYAYPKIMSKDGLETAGEFIEELLSSYQSRLGKVDTAELSHHDYYVSIDFEVMNRKKMTAPYIPNITHASDVSHFRHDGDRISEESIQQEYDGDECWCKDF